MSSARSGLNNCQAGRAFSNATIVSLHCAKLKVGFFLYQPHSWTYNMNATFVGLHWYRPHSIRGLIRSMPHSWAYMMPSWSGFIWYRPHSWTYKMNATFVSLHDAELRVRLLNTSHIRELIRWMVHSWAYIMNATFVDLYVAEMVGLFLLRSATFVDLHDECHIRELTCCRDGRAL